MARTPSSKSEGRKPYRGRPATRSGMTRSEAAKAQADRNNAWRQWVSDSAVLAVDTALAHVHAVVQDQVAQFGAFPAFLVTGRKDGEFELDSLDPSEFAGSDPQQVLDRLRDTAREKAKDLLVAALACPATLPDRSGASAVVVDVAHRERLSLDVVQEYRVVESKGNTYVNFEEPVVERAEPWLFTPRD